MQHVVRVGVSLMVAAPNDRGGARGRERLSALLTRARQALAGWAPPEQREVLSFRRGRLVSLEDGRLQWLDEYEIRRVARAGVIEAAQRCATTTPPYPGLSPPRGRRGSAGDGEGHE